MGSITYIGISGNELAGGLAAAAHAMDPSIFVDRFAEARRIIQDRILRHHPDDDVVVVFRPCRLTRAISRGQLGISSIATQRCRRPGTGFD